MRIKYPLIACLAGICFLGCGQQSAPAPAKEENAATEKSDKPSATATKTGTASKPSAAKGKPAAEKVAEVVNPKSVFEEALPPRFTDPFFPKTKRFGATKTGEKPGAVVNPTVVLLEQIVLKGISGPVGRRLALINNYTFAAGESGAVRLPKGSARIEVLEVRERSAVIKVETDPVPKEIFLRPEP